MIPVDRRPEYMDALADYSPTTGELSGQGGIWPPDRCLAELTHANRIA